MKTPIALSLLMVLYGTPAASGMERDNLYQKVNNIKDSLLQHGVDTFLIYTRDCVCAALGTEQQVFLFWQHKGNTSYVSFSTETGRGPTTHTYGVFSYFTKSRQRLEGETLDTVKDVSHFVRRDLHFFTGGKLFHKTVPEYYLRRNETSALAGLIYMLEYKLASTYNPRGAD